MAKFLKRIRHIFSNLNSKYRVSLKNPHDDKEAWYVYLTPLNIITGFFAFIVVVFIFVVTIVAFTPVMDFIPGYPGNKSRNVLIESNMRLDSLERQLNLWTNYYDNLVRIMDGKAPVSVGSTIGIIDSTSSKMSYIDRIQEDSILRSQMEGEGIYKLQGTATGKGAKNYTEMFPPLKGLIKNKFNPKAGIFGIDIVSGGNQPVMSIMDGTVVQASWTPTQGNAIYILHSGNIMSVYLYTSRPLKKIGDRVSAGEVIAFTGSSTTDDKGKGFIEFQLWYSGAPVDPENYIVF